MSSFETEKNENYVDFDLDEYLGNNENRKPNKFGLYRLNCLVIGKTGSGKTTWLIKNLLAGNIDDFQKIICIIPRESYDSGIYQRIRTDKRLKNHFIFYIIGEESLPSVEELNSIHMKIALIVDDFINTFTKNDWLVLKRYITQCSRITKDMFVMFVNSFSSLQFNDMMRSYYDNQVFDKQQLNELYNTTKSFAHTPLIAVNNGQPEHSLAFGDKWIISTTH